MAEILPLNLPPAEAVEHFRAKGHRLSFDWRDVYADEHARVFTVAKVMELDVLADIRAEVDKAIADGITLPEFRRNLEPKLQEKGWWGRKRMVDPETGEEREVQLGSPRRLRIIYDTNLRTAYAAGSWERMQRTKEKRPYLRYVAIRDDRTRPQHAAWHNTVLPIDHPWWRTHYPPNGWRCRCSVQQLSERDLERYGYQLTERTRPSPTREWTNPRTGQVRHIPKGIDPGFDYNVGISGQAHTRSLLTQAIERVAAGAPDMARAAIRAGLDAPDFERFVSSPSGAYPVLIVPDEARAAIGAQGRVGVLSAESLTKNLKHHPELSIEDYRRLPLAGEDPLLIVQDSPRSVVVITRGADRLMWTAVKATRIGDEVYVTSYRRTRAAGIARLRQGQGTKVLVDRL